MKRSQSLCYYFIFIFVLFVIGQKLNGQELLEAVRAGDLAKVSSIVKEEPALINLKNSNGETILFSALVNSQLEITQYLLINGADVNVKNSSHFTPLHVACSRSLPLEFVKLLVEKSADVNAVSKYQGKPLDLAFERSGEDVVNYLKSKGAEFTELQFETKKIASNLYRISFLWGMRNNLIAFSGPDGVLIIDSGFNKRAVDEIRKTIKGFASEEIKYVINTHDHWDHNVGNFLLQPDSAVIGDGNLDDVRWKNIITKTEKPLADSSNIAFPASHIMTYNNEKIFIIPYIGLHSQNDILIYFPESEILCMGDLLLSQSCPATGNIAGYMELLNKLLAVFPSSTTFISGHGKDLNWTELKKYRNDLNEMIDMIKKEHALGKTSDDMIKSDLLGIFKADYSQLEWLGPDSWLRRVEAKLISGELK